LHYNIKYSYDNQFISKLYADFTDFGFDNFYSEQNSKEKEYYAILECPIGASKAILKKNYKRYQKYIIQIKFFMKIKIC
jgi:hypothetical protein